MTNEGPNKVQNSFITSLIGCQFVYLHKLGREHHVREKTRRVPYTFLNILQGAPTKMRGAMVGTERVKVFNFNKK